MLSIAIIKNSMAASSYYAETDNYYSKDHSPSEWQGAGAKTLGLTGSVDQDTFTRLLNGQMPNGETIHNAADGHRAGIDLTFSAPKSISIQSLVGADQRLIEAHDKAVIKTLTYAELLANYRITQNKETQLKPSGNLIIASFRHDLSRELDPNLHTHAVIINATHREDGQWRALEAGEIFRQKMLIGAMYRSELAMEVQKLGYEVRQTHLDGRFELAHMSDKQIEAFSSRSKAIESALAAQGKTRDNATAKEKEIAALSSRKAKEEVDRGKLLETWLQKSQEMDINLTPVAKANHLTQEDKMLAAKEAVEFAIAHHIERQAIITQTQIIRAALEQGTAKTDLTTIQYALQQKTEAGGLIKNGDRYTTHAAQLREKEILAVETNGRNSIAPILTEQQAQLALSSSSLNAGQQAGASLILSTPNRLVAIQGAAGTGKTTMLRQANTLASASGYEVYGLAPSAAAARELTGANIKSETIAAFNLRSSTKLNSKSLLIVDEAGMVSAQDMRDLLMKAETARARIVLVGDVQQLKAIEAGKPFAQLQEAGIARVEMSEIQRQHSIELRQAVELAAQGNSARSLALLEKSVIEIDRAQDRYLAIAKDYADLPVQDRANTLIVAGTNSARASINENVRQELGLSGKGMLISILERKDLTQAQSKSSLAYQIGDVLQAHKDYTALGLKRGDLTRVTDIADGRVELARIDGQKILWQPALQTKMTAYREVTRELSVGDDIRLTANDRGLGVVNGDRGKVTGIDLEQNKITIAKADGNNLTVDASKPLHLDHGYCSTVHAAQGQTSDRILIDVDSKSATANESSYYVAISRARDEAKIYTDDKSMLPDAIAREDSKSAALELSTSQNKSNHSMEYGA